MKKITIIFLFFSILANAQEYIPIHTQYLLGNYFLINPAVAGINDTHKFRGTYRNQWIGESQSPYIITASYQGRFDKNLGLGAYVYRDKNGFHNSTGVELSAAYHINLGTSLKYNRSLSFGLAYAGRNRSVNITNLSISDPALQNNNNFQSGLNVGAYFIYNNYYGGVSASQVLTEGVNSGSYKPTYTLILGKLFELDEYFTFYVEPSILVRKIEGIDTELDFNTKFYHKPLLKEYKMWYGVSYKAFVNDGVNSTSITPFIGIDYKKFSFGYSIDLDVSTQLGGFYNGHQFVLGIDLFEKRYSSLQCGPLNF